MAAKGEGRFSIKLIGDAEGLDPDDDNVDVEIVLDDGSRYMATFFTLRNIQSLFEKNARTGECKDGLYLWASDMILVKELSPSVIAETVAGLLSSGEFASAFSRAVDRAESISGGRP